MLTIDGSIGEGGGQILRTSLGLSLVTGKPFRLEKIRAARPKPGLRAQHHTAVEAAAKIGRAEVTGAKIKSQEITFVPGEVEPGEYTFHVGTAGSATLVLQTVLPALILAKGPSTLTLDGGTHNPFAPPYDFLEKAFLPLVNRMGPTVRTKLNRPGFFPAGGGRFHVSVEPAAKLARLDLPDRGDVRRRSARVLLSRLPEHIASREIKVLRKRLGWD
ncbi:MAG: RNA 3'-terminal phosphate cyclase, partial [Planctomycetota bacterium]